MHISRRYLIRKHFYIQVDQKTVLLYKKIVYEAQQYDQVTELQ